MRGNIHGIWLTESGGKLHPAIIPNLSSWIADAAKAEFGVILWTNIKELDPQEIGRLNDAKIVVVDHSICKKSPLYKYFSYFLAKGINGDKAAFAVASDILRMTILDFTPNDKYFIYVDANDIQLFDLQKHLTELHLHMKDNAFGFSFKVVPIKSTMSGVDFVEMRNDILIALKEKNINFFQDYLRAYWSNVDRTYKTYRKPLNADVARSQASTISNETSAEYFTVSKSHDQSFNIVAKFGNYIESQQIVNSDGYLKSARISEHGKTWLPSEEIVYENEELELQAKFMESLLAEKKQVQNTQSNVNITSYAIFVIVVVVATSLWVFVKRKWLSRSKGTAQ